MDALKAYLKKQPRAAWVLWPLWLVACFFVAGYGGGLVIATGAKVLGFGDIVSNPLGILIFQTLVYIMLLGLALSVPYAKRMVTRQVLGIARLMSWGDIGLGVAGYLVYFIVLIAVMMGLTALLPQFNVEQTQELGFTALYGWDRYIGFIVFAVVAPFVEELLMRGFLYGKLREAKMPMWPAALVVSVLFGLAHGQWNVGVDTFLLSMVACYLREATGSIWAGVLVHMIKNIVAYTLLFVVMAP